MSTGYGSEGIRQVRATLLGARHVSERFCDGLSTWGAIIECSIFTFTFKTHILKHWFTQTTRMNVVYLQVLVAMLITYHNLWIALTE